VDTEEHVSDSTLHVNITGPDFHNLNIFDLPGLMHSKSLLSVLSCDYLYRIRLTDHGIVGTTRYHEQEDVAIVRSLITELISHPQTIILYVELCTIPKICPFLEVTYHRAVADATNSISNQEVFELARGVDPEGLRTLGVLTKCDAIQPGDEKRVCDLRSTNLLSNLTNRFR